MAILATLGEAYVQIRADLSDLDKDFNGVKTKFESVTKDLGKNFTSVGKAMTYGITGPMVAVGGGAIKMASDFESSFAGVLKTVSDATDSMGNITNVGENIRQGFRNMAKEIPISVNELNRIGEAAGQLGIKSDAIMEFTRVMADLGVTTNLTSDQAATSIAQIANVMGTASADFGRFGATLVALGNDGASTEADIVQMAARIAGAGKQVGLVEGEVLAIANALASVGIEVEAGGSAISKVLINMGVAAATGNDDLEKFAAAAKMSAGEFKQLFEKDAAGALQAFVVGLGKTKEAGGSILAVLDEMGIKEVRMRDAVLRLAGSGTILADSLTLQDAAWKANSALTKEAAQRYKTFDSQMVIVLNQLKDVGIELGMALLPILKNFLTAAQPFISMLAGMAQAFSALPQPVQTVVLVVGGLVAALGPLLWAFGSMVTGIGAAIPALVSISTALGFGPVITALVSSFKLLLPILGPAGWIVAGVTAVYMAWKHWDKITAIVSAVYTAVKTWLLDKFQAIVDGIKNKIAAVTGFFKDMYEKVVGHSYVPDMIEAIKNEFSRLQEVMVVPAQDAIAQTTDAFEGMATKAKGWLGKLFEGIGGEDFGAKIGDTIMNALQGGGDVGKSIGGVLGNSLGKNLGGMFGDFAKKHLTGKIGKVLGSTLGSMIPGVGTMLGSMLGDWVGKGFKKILPKLGSMFKGIGNGIKRLFGFGGGPSKQELANREEVAGVRGKLQAGLNESQRGELAGAIKGHWKGNESGAATAIALRDAFMRAGFTERDGLDWADRLHKAEKGGPGAVQAVLRQMRELLGSNMPKLAKGGVISAGIGGLAELHGVEVVAPLNRLQSMMGEMRNDPMDMVNAMQQSGMGRNIVFSPVFKGTLDHEMKSLVRTKLWPMFLDILKESSALRGDVQAVLGAV